MRVLQQPRPCFRCQPRLERARKCTLAGAHVSRRDLSVLLSASALSLAPANAFEEAPAGFYRHTDRLDGYTFAYPDTWIVVTTSGNDVFYRNSRVADENVFVDISSPSSSKYSSVQDLGTPDKAANRLQKQFLTELMSTRLGVKREIEPVFSQARTGKDGNQYYDIGIRVQSFASRQQLAVSDTQRQDAIVQEFDRVLLTTLGVANERLYEFRVQTSYKRYSKNPSLYEVMADSFRCKEV